MLRERIRRATLPPPQETIDKLGKSVREGNFYEAQQMYKSFAARYTAAQKYGEALDIIQSGASLQLKSGQITCGAELAALFVDTLVKGKFRYNEETIDRVRKIYEDFPKIPMPVELGDDNDLQNVSEAIMAAKVRVDCCSTFLRAAIKWSFEFGDYRYGSPELHSMLSEYICSESPDLDMAKVSVHLIRANNPTKFATTLVNFIGKCYPGEDDLAIARAVLMYLSLGNLRDANYLVEEVKKQLDDKEIEFPLSELIDFIMYLLETLERDALPLFRILRQNFKSSIDREASFPELLDEIGEKFYGIQRKSGLQGIFGDFVKMMGGDI